MELFLKILGYLSGPLIGAVIGYFTNYIAVKMLFRPYYPKRIGKLRIPFTPGIIPKRQPALAKAVGKAVGESLFTGEDLKRILLSEETVNRVADFVADAAASLPEGTTAEALALRVTDGAGLEAGKERLAAFFTDRLVAAAERMELGSLVAAEGAAAIKEKKASLGVFAFVLSDEAIASVLASIGGKIDAYVKEHGREKALPAVREQVDRVAASSVSELLRAADAAALKKAVRTVYESVIADKIGEFAKTLDIASVVEEKVNAMDVKELEALCLSVMKKELSAIVNLGALIGLLLGILNLFF